MVLDVVHGRSLTPTRAIPGISALLAGEAASFVEDLANAESIRPETSHVESRRYSLCALDSVERRRTSQRGYL
jgi:hypothetical protein